MRRCHLARAPLGNLTSWTFRGCRPEVEPCRASGRHAQRCLNRGHAYCQVEKKGRLLCISNHKAVDTFVLEASWVLDWWRKRKLSNRAASREILYHRNRVEASLREIDFVVSRERAQSDRAEQRSLRQLLASTFQRFKDFPLVTKWQAQFGPIWYGKMPRFTFLVLEGPSRLGKTQLGMSLFGATSTLYVDCQGVSEPNVTGFVRGTHKAVLFDGISWELVAANKVLFQAGIEGADLCQSKCQQFSVWRFLYQTPLILCTNRWLLNDEQSEHRGWLEANSVYVHIHEQCY